MSDTPTPVLKVLSSLDEIPAIDWDALANPGAPSISYDQQDWIVSPETTPHESSEKSESVSQETEFNPMLSHAFLQALEESGCVGWDAGWIPQHIYWEADGKPVAAIPTYAKSHSQGEYVFDHPWAEAFERAGGNYYPKLQSSIPFTPVPGRRLLISPFVNRARAVKVLTEGLKELTHRIEGSSAHLTFLTEQEWKELGDQGFLLRTDQQFHWENNGYSDFENFLNALSSRKRKSIRKERKTALEHSIEIEWITGSEITESHWDAFYEFYIDTSSRKWGSPYLNREFFSLLGERLSEHTLLIMAEREGRYIAGALNMIGNNTLYGRNWGCIEHHDCLHFEICYYQAIEFALAKGLKRVEAGAQGNHKLARGYMPSLTYSAHWIANPSLRHAVAQYLDRERDVVLQEQKILAEHGPFRQNTP
ncbi:hypothetical protein PsAD2_04236 [Pseudovibrio axinellae]|uniref:FemAB family protein n=1 Tax=Pseudovibrio axinellae TaxID=989403 RepID=A0A165TWI1_9HYPH|nr:GNAT family N-acetyltransferase [Pseudovibrio axinellae]KZL06723.1 hypothetical protein PsAD2_04236 [Pseudovibrio axinellae]SER61876.1 hypothetical protein SAMN05421798_11448 [Pseudovibrio axinellae]